MTPQTDDLEQAGDLIAKISHIEIAKTEIDIEAADDIEKYRKDNLYDEPRVRIIFENGGILQILQPEDMDEPVEESFRPNDPHSVWEGWKLNGFKYEDEWDEATRVQKAAEWNLEEMSRRDADDPLDDWENLANCFDEEVRS